MKTDIAQLIKQSRKTGAHFIELKRIAEELFSNNPAKISIQVSRKLFVSEAHQARSLAIYLLGINSAESKQCLNFLHTRVSMEKVWRVQEFLAQAFNRFCSGVG